MMRYIPFPRDREIDVFSLRVVPWLCIYKNVGTWHTLAKVSIWCEAVRLLGAVCIRLTTCASLK